MEKGRAQWGSKIGFILAAAGSAVGLGNIWKFPGRAFEGGGGCFLLIYLVMVVFLGAPMMLTELSVGRASQANIVVAFLTEHFSWPRKGTTIAVCAVMFLIGCLYTCSQAASPIKGVWLDAANGVTFPAFCDFMEYLTDRIMIPVCALGCCIFVGWVWKPESAIAEIEQNGVRFPLAKVYPVLVKYVAPIAILTILIMSFASGMTLS